MIEIDDVSVTLGRTRALDGVSATIESGTFVGLIGPNGAGKSTLLRTIGGILRADSGSIALDGAAVRSLSSREVSRRVAMVPQDTHLSFGFSVREVVAMGRTPYRRRFANRTPADDEYIDRALELTETTALAERPITAVSGGERQRVLLARALAQDAPTLLLDEPTASLDINHQVRMLELVTELVDAGKTVVAAIHDLNLAAHYCDSLVLLSDGRVLDAGPPEAVLTEETLRSAFDARAVVSRHPITGSVYVTALPEWTPNDGSGRVHVVGGGGTASRLLYVLAAAGYSVSVGVLNEGDSDLETARTLGLETIAIEPFAAITDDVIDPLSRAVREADVTVVADVEVGAGNLANLEAAAASDHVVVVEDRPFADRNYAGDAARACYERLCERATVVPTARVTQAVAAAIEDSECLEDGSRVDEGTESPDDGEPASDVKPADEGGSASELKPTHRSTNRRE